MDFQSPEPVIRALRERVEHGVFGYLAFEQPVREQLVELGLLEGQVAEDAVLDPFAERADHRLGRLEIHIRHPERQDIGTVLLPLGAIGVPPIDETIEVVGHGGSSYHAPAKW